MIHAQHNHLKLMFTNEFISKVNNTGMICNIQLVDVDILKFEKYLRLFGYLINYLAIKSPETIRKSICRNFSTAANRLVFNILREISLFST